LAFISANLGAQEVLGMAASGAKYGIATSHFYWIGAIPAMVFVGVFMMPFYYGSRARSIPEYLRLRFDEKTRGFKRHFVRHHDSVFFRHLDVCNCEADPDAARI
jgi:SSS family solute:Na+ symporter